MSVWYEAVRWKNNETSPEKMLKDILSGIRRHAVVSGKTPKDITEAVLTKEGSFSTFEIGVEYK